MSRKPLVSGSPTCDGVLVNLFNSCDFSLRLIASKKNRVVGCFNDNYSKKLINKSVETPGCFVVLCAVYILAKLQLSVKY